MSAEAANAPVEPDIPSAEQEVLETDELLEELLAKFGPQSLKSASLVCKRWHRLAAAPFRALEEQISAAADVGLSTGSLHAYTVLHLGSIDGAGRFLTRRIQEQT